VRTNYVDRCKTNWAALTLTNWETVVLLKTNWVTQPVTNVVQVDLPARPAAAPAESSEAADPQEAAVETTSPPPTGWAGALAIEASRTSRTGDNELVEVQLKIRRTDGTAALPQVQRWRVEREDGAVLLVGQDQQFKRLVPVGKYKVEAKLKAEGDNPPVSVRGTLSVTLQDATVQPRLLVKK